MFIYWKLLAALLLLGGLVGYFYYSQNKISKLTEANVTLRVKVADAEESIKVLEANKNKQSASLNSLILDNQKANQELSRYLEIFDKHNLNKLARAKPGLIEKRINDGTKAVLKDLENETSTNTD